MTMLKNNLPDFIVIDDDPINNLICHKIIQLTIPGSVIYTFTEPQDGLDHIQSNYPGNDGKKAILFLDINMPVSGWEVLEMFEKFPDSIKEQVKIFMLSSSVNPHDKEKASANAHVTGYISKSLSQEKLQALFPQFL